MNDHSRLFAFENDFVVSLRCVPMAVRFKLDTVGVKVTLRQWSRLTPEDRRELLLQPCIEVEEVDLYRRRLLELIALRTGEEAQRLPLGATVCWEQTDGTPDAIVSFAAGAGVEPPSCQAWRSLSPLQRFVLLKLSRDNHDNINFVPALQEFGLHRPDISSPEAEAA